MPRHTRPDAEHGVDQHQLPLLKCPTLPTPAGHQAIHPRQHDENKNTVEKQGDRRRMRRVPHPLHLHHPVGIQRNQQQPQQDRPQRHRALLCRRVHGFGRRKSGSGIFWYE